MGMLTDYLNLDLLPQTAKKEDEPWPLLYRDVERFAFTIPEKSREIRRLALGLYDCLFSSRSLNARTHRERVQEALIHISVFLRAEELPDMIASEIMQLSVALGELKYGTVRPIFEPSKTSNSVDPANIWECRALVAAAVNCMLQQNRSSATAISFIEKEFGFLSPILVRNGKRLGTSAMYWRKEFKASRVKVEEARLLYERASALHSHNISTSFIAYKLLADATVRAATISDASFAALMPVIRIRRQAQTKVSYPP